MMGKFLEEHAPGSQTMYIQQQKALTEDYPDGDVPPPRNMPVLNTKQPKAKRRRLNTDAPHMQDAANNIADVEAMLRMNNGVYQTNTICHSRRIQMMHCRQAGGSLGLHNQVGRVGTGTEIR